MAPCHKLGVDLQSVSKFISSKDYNRVQYWKVHVDLSINILISLCFCVNFQYTLAVQYGTATQIDKFSTVTCISIIPDLPVRDKFIRC